MAKKKATHLVKKKDKIVKNTEVAPEPVVEIKGIKCDACGAIESNKLIIGAGMGQHVCRRCYKAAKSLPAALGR